MAPLVMFFLGVTGVLGWPLFGLAGCAGLLVRVSACGDEMGENNINTVLCSVFPQW
jgi:hypothetical protein